MQKIFNRSPNRHEEAEAKTPEDDSKYNLNGIELASNEVPQEEAGSKGPTLLAQNNTPAEDKPEELSSELTDNALPLEGKLRKNYLQKPKN